MAGRPRNPETDRLSKDLAVSKRRAEQLKAQGNGAESGSEMRTARLKKLTVEIAFYEERLAKLKRETIPITEAIQQGIRLADITNQFSSECITNWPTELAGKSEIEVREILSTEFGELNKQLLAAANDL